MKRYRGIPDSEQLSFFNIGHRLQHYLSPSFLQKHNYILYKQLNRNLKVTDVLPSLLVENLLFDSTYKGKRSRDFTA